MYAADIYVTFSAATIPDLESQINSDLKYIDHWHTANKLSLNVAKTELLERLSTTLTANDKRQTAKMKLFPSVFGSLYSIVVFAVNSKRHFSIFV